MLEVLVVLMAEQRMQAAAAAAAVLLAALRLEDLHLAAAVPEGRHQIQEQPEQLIQVAAVAAAEIPLGAAAQVVQESLFFLILWPQAHQLHLTPQLR